MASIVKILGSEVALSDTASNIGNAKLVRVYNGNAADKLVTIKSAGGTTLGTITVATKDTVNLAKGATDTVEIAAATAGLKAVSIGFYN